MSCAQTATRQTGIVLRRLVKLFEPEAAQQADSLLALIISDYVAYYGPATRARRRWNILSQTSDSPRRLALLFIPRLINNASMHATVLIRLQSRSPRFMAGFWRTVLIAKHSIEIGLDLKIGPGLVLPHPIGISLGSHVRIGRNVTLLHRVGIGTTFFPARGYRPWEPDGSAQIVPVIGDDVIIFMDSTLVGGINVGAGAVIAAGAWVDQDLPPKAIQPGRAALFRHLAAAGDTSSRDRESATRSTLGAD
jgi:serine O-acetyltransferase